jgi:hypothetical protein
MRRPNRIALVVVFACLAAGTATEGLHLAAQEKPDFSGRWTTDPDPAAAAEAAGAREGGRGAGGRGGPGRGARGDMGSGWGSTITIAQTATSLTVEYAFFTRGDMQPPLRFAYALDGSRSSNTVMMGRGMQTQISRAAWEGLVLNITTTHAFTDPATGKPIPVDVTQALSLQSPTSLLVVTTRPGVMGAPETTTRSVYRKLP